MAVTAELQQLTASQFTKKSIMSTRGPTEVGKEYRVPRSQFRPGNEAIVTMTITEGAPEIQRG